MSDVKVINLNHPPCLLLAGYNARVGRPRKLHQYGVTLTGPLCELMPPPPLREGSAMGSARGLRGVCEPMRGHSECNAILV